MRKYLKLGLPTVALIILQVIIYELVFLTVIWLRKDCTVAGDYYCATASPADYLPQISAVLLPPLIIKLAIKFTKYKLSWRSILLATAIAAAIVLISAFVVYPILTFHPAA